MAFLVGSWNSEFGCHEFHGWWPLDDAQTKMAVWGQKQIKENVGEVLWSPWEVTNTWKRLHIEGLQTESERLESDGAGLPTDKSSAEVRSTYFAAAECKWMKKII